LYRELLRMGLILDTGAGPRLSVAGKELVGHLPAPEEMLH
jgi:hypothetical protein